MSSIRRETDDLLPGQNATEAQEHELLSEAKSPLLQNYNKVSSNNNNNNDASLLLESLAKQPTPTAQHSANRNLNNGSPMSDRKSPAKANSQQTNDDECYYDDFLDDIDDYNEYSKSGKYPSAIKSLKSWQKEEFSSSTNTSPLNEIKGVRTGPRSSSSSTTNSLKRPTSIGLSRQKQTDDVLPLKQSSGSVPVKNEFFLNTNPPIKIMIEQQTVVS
jgi:hypothetical protein